MLFPTHWSTFMWWCLCFNTTRNVEIFVNFMLTWTLLGVKGLVEVYQKNPFLSSPKWHVEFYIKINDCLFFHSLLKNYLQQTNFSGVSGRVIFRDGDRYLPTVEMAQRSPSGVVTVGRVLPNMYGHCGKSRGCLQMNETSIQWPGGSRPTDGRSREWHLYL